MKPLRRVPGRLWRKLDQVLPNLSEAEQNDTLTAMRGRALATVDFYALMVLSASIAFLGLRQNSSAVVIGAMLVAPLMSPIMAMGFGVVTGYPRLFRRAAASTLAGMAVAVGTAALLAFLIPSKVPTAEILARAAPNLLDLMVALVSGAAGAYATCRKELASSLPGVAIAVALVPPLCVVGYGLGAGHLDIAQGAGLLFATNLASIVLAGIAVFWLLGFRPLNETDLPSFRRSLRWSILGVALLTLPLGYVSYLQIREANIASCCGANFNGRLRPRQARAGKYHRQPVGGQLRGGFYGVCLRQNGRRGERCGAAKAARGGCRWAGDAQGAGDPLTAWRGEWREKRRAPPEQADRERIGKHNFGFTVKPLPRDLYRKTFSARPSP